MSTGPAEDGAAEAYAAAIDRETLAGPPAPRAAEVYRHRDVVHHHHHHHHHHDVHVEDPQLPPPMGMGEPVVSVKVEDPLADIIHRADEDGGGEANAANADQEQAALDAGEEAAAAAMEAAAAAEAAEACLGNVLDDVGVGVDVHHHHHEPAPVAAAHPVVHHLTHQRHHERHEPAPLHHERHEPAPAAAPVAALHHEPAPVAGRERHHREEHEVVITEADAEIAHAVHLEHHRHEHEDHEPTPVDASGAAVHHHETTEDDEVALAAAAAAAAVQAADGMAVVVDQALLATAAAAAASQVANVLAEQQPVAAHHGVPQDVGVDGMMLAAEAHGCPGSPDSNLKLGDHGVLLQQRREKDRKRYSAMTPDARATYNAHRRELYHKQGEAARKRRRERERDRYHSLEGEDKKTRNERRAKLERDRYNRLSKDALAARNAKRRDRAKQRKLQQKGTAPPGAAPAAMTPAEEAAAIVATVIPPPPRIEVKSDPTHGGGAQHPSHLPGTPGGDAVMAAPLAEATVDVDHAMADASALAAEVAEQVIAGTNLEGAMEAVVAAAPAAGTAAHGADVEEDGPTVQI